MRLLSYNILNGGVGRADPIGEVIQTNRPDVVTLIEADDVWVVERIARRLNMDYVVAPGDKHSVAVLSRFTISQSINHALLDPAGPRSWVEVEIEAGNGPPLALTALHLHPRATIADEQIRLSQLSRVLAVTRPWRDDGRPHVVAGDFNANAPDQRIDPARCKRKTREAFDANGMIPRDAIRSLLDVGYVDTLAARGGGAFDQATFTTHEPGQRVDYIFTHGLTVHDAWIETDRLAMYASDHYPIGAEVHA